MTIAACTIISRNYLPYARLLGDSLRKYHPDCEFYVLMVDSVDARDADETFEVINVRNLNIQNFHHLAFRYNIMELNASVKPTFLASLFAGKGVDKLLYF